MAVRRTYVLMVVAAGVVGWGAYLTLRTNAVGPREGSETVRGPVSVAAGEQKVAARPVVRTMRRSVGHRAAAVAPVSARVEKLEVLPPEGPAPSTVPAVAQQKPEPVDEIDDEGPVVPLEVAREALAGAGADEEATLAWAMAINDPALSPHDRQDLIEDLNEVGIDPKNLTPDDLPLIVNRLEMIEELAPDAMDQTNLDAFAEAYKDLSNMYARVVGQP